MIRNRKAPSSCRMMDVKDDGQGLFDISMAVCWDKVDKSTDFSIISVSVDVFAYLSTKASSNWNPFESVPLGDSVISAKSNSESKKIKSYLQICKNIIN